jgi:hypothetical protein
MLSLDCEVVGTVADGGAVLQDVVIPEAEDGVALLADEGVAAGVMGIVGVLGAVDFDDEPFLAAAKICEVRPYGKLADELVTAELAALEFQPE